MLSSSLHRKQFVWLARGARSCRNDGGRASRFGCERPRPVMRVQDGIRTELEVQELYLHL